MSEESTKNKQRLLEQADSSTPSSNHSFGPDEIVELNKDLPDSTITLFLPKDFDKRLIPVKARALRNWWEGDDKTRMHARFCLPLTMASGLGYYILSPATFTVSWDGDPTHDSEVNIIDACSHAQIDNHSSFGSFTVQARFIVRTKKIGDFIYIKGVANQYRQPFNVMEAMIESWWSPSEFGIVCLVNQPGTFTIKKGDPLAQMYVVNMNQAQYGLGVVEGYPDFWKEWTARRDPSIYDGRNMDYLRGLLPDGTPVCPHMKAWSGAHNSDAVVEQSQVIERHWAAGDDAKDVGNIDGAIRYYTLALQVAEDKNEVSEDLLKKLHSAAIGFQGKEKHPLAINLLRKWIELSERNFTPGLPMTADVYGELGYSYRHSRDFENAAKVLQEALQRKRDAQVVPLSLARSLIDLGTLHDFCGRRDQAAPLLKEAKEIYEEHLPADNAEHLYLKNVYGCLLTHIGHFDEAQALYDEVIKERTRQFGDDSLDVAFTLNDLGFHYKEQKNYPESEKMFLKCIANRQKQLGPDDLEVALAMEDLSWMYRESGQFEKAKKELEQVLAIRKNKFLNNSPEVKGTYLAIADVCDQLGDRETAAQARKFASGK
jgi:tetratricopeptide (TPR) repeat protein